MDAEIRRKEEDIRRRQDILDIMKARPEPIDNLEKVLLWAQWNLEIVLSFLCGVAIGYGIARRRG